MRFLRFISFFKRAKAKRAISTVDMLGESYSGDKRRKRRFRRKKRRRAERDYQSMWEGVVIFALFVLLIGVAGVCLWAVIPGFLRYLRITLGW